MWAFMNIFRHSLLIYIFDLSHCIFSFFDVWLWSLCEQIWWGLKCGITTLTACLLRGYKLWEWFLCVMFKGKIFITSMSLELYFQYIYIFHSFPLPLSTTLKMVMDGKEILGRTWAWAFFLKLHEILCHSLHPHIKHAGRVISIFISVVFWGRF